MCFHFSFFSLPDKVLVDSFKLARFAVLQKLTYKYAQKQPQSMKNKNLKKKKNIDVCIQTQKQ
jgi:hypothetical protein